MAVNRAPRQLCGRSRSWALEEEAHHLTTGVGSAWLGVRSGRAPAGPCVAGSVQDPLLQHRSPGLVRLNGAGVTYPTPCLAVGDGGPKIRRRLRLGDDLIAVDGAHSRVAVTVEHDGRHTASGPAVVTRWPDGRRMTLPHRSESGRNVAGGPARQSGMDADRRIEVRVGRAHYCRRRAPGR